MITCDNSEIQYTGLFNVSRWNEFNFRWTFFKMVPPQGQIENVSNTYRYLWMQILWKLKKRGDSSTEDREMKKKKILQTKLALQKDRFLLWFRYDYLTLFWFLVSIYNTWNMLLYLQSPVPFCCALSHSIWMGSCYSLLFQSVGKFGWHTWVSIFSKFHFNRFVYNQIMSSIKQWFLCFSFFLKIQLNFYQDYFMIATRWRAHRICD